MGFDQARRCPAQAAQRREIRDLIAELAEGDTTVLLSTHMLPEIEAFFEQVIAEMLNPGVLLSHDPDSKYCRFCVEQELGSAD